LRPAVSFVVTPYNRLANPSKLAAAMRVSRTTVV
jgi:hypothetical protein